MGGDTGDVTKSALNSLQVLVWFVVLLLYHLSALRMDGAASADVLEAKQQDFKLAVLDNGDGKFGEAVKAAFAKRAPKVSVTVVNVKDGIPADLKADAVVLPGSLAMNTRLRQMLRRGSAHLTAPGSSSRMMRRAFTGSMISGRWLNQCAHWLKGRKSARNLQQRHIRLDLYCICFCGIVRFAVTVYVDYAWRLDGRWFLMIYF